MKWTSQMAAAVEYVEANLDGTIENEKIAQISNCSYDSFQRIFSFIFDISLSEYIRYRRLTLAAVELRQTDVKICDVAMKYGYASHEAFSRAFFRFHGIKPLLMRQGGCCIRHCSKAFVSVNSVGGLICYNITKLIGEETVAMRNNLEPRIEKRQFILAGINSFVKWGEDFEKIIRESRQALENVLPAIANVTDSSARVKYFYDENGMKDGYSYFDGVEVSAAATTPDGVTLKLLPQSEFAVFVADEGQGGDYARNTWLPQSGYRENYVLLGDLEIKHGDGGCEFWLPICK